MARASRMSMRVYTVDGTGAVTGPPVESTVDILQPFYLGWNSSTWPVCECSRCEDRLARGARYRDNAGVVMEP